MSRIVRALYLNSQKEGAFRTEILFRSFLGVFLSEMSYNIVRILAVCVSQKMNNAPNSVVCVWLSFVLDMHSTTQGKDKELRHTTAVLRVLLCLKGA